MLTSMRIQAQNISAVENGRYGCGNLFLSTGALRRLLGGVFVRTSNRLLNVEACGHVNTWPLTSCGGFPPRRFSAPSPWKVRAELIKQLESIMTRTSNGAPAPVKSLPHDA